MAFHVTSPSSADDDTPTERLVEACRQIDWDDVPAAEQDHARALLSDFFGVLLGSVDAVESSRIVRDWAQTYGDGPATIAGETSGVAPAVGAFANASVGHGIELDDTHSGSSTHPGVVVIPTALAVAEQENASSHEFLGAVVAGYELLIRIGRVADPAALYDQGFHPTACCGVFGAALTAARLRGLDREATVNAVGIAGSFAAGNLEYLADGTLSKRIQPGVAAQAGVIAAALADRGYTGPRSILAGESGFLQGYSDGSDPSRLFDAPDDEYTFEIARTGVKPHACCRYNQTPIDCTLAITNNHEFDLDNVESITVDVVEPAIDIVAEPHSEKVRPRTPTDAQFSLPYSVAVALVAGEAFFEQYREPYLTDEQVLSIAERVAGEHDPALDEEYPDQWGASVTVTLTDGTEHTAAFDTCRGDPGNMLTSEELESKVRALAGRELDDGQLDALVDAANAVDQADDVSALTDLLS